MNIYLLSILINSLASFFLVFFILRKKDKRGISKKTLLLFLLIGAMYFIIFLMQFPFEEKYIYLFANFLMYTMILLPLLIFRITLIFTDRISSYKIIFILLFLLSFLFIFLNYRGIFISSVFRGNYLYYLPAVSKYFEYYSIYLFVYISLSLWVLFKKYYFSTSFFKQKINNAILAIVLLYLSLVANYFTWYGLNVPPFGNFLLNFLLLITIYFFLSKKIIDFKLALRKSTVILTSFVAMFILVVAMKYLFLIFFPEILIWDDYVILILSIFIYPLIKKQLFIMANRYFFTSLYDSAEVITKFNKKLRSIIDIDEIYALLDITFARTFHTKSFAVLFYDKEAKKYTIKYNTGFNIYADAEFESDSMLHRKYIELDKIAEIKELSKDIKFQERKLIQIFNHFQVDLVVPLTIKDKILGVMIFSGKESGDYYNKEDLGVLNVISSQATVAIDNALKYEETKRFKLKLQREIKRATQELRIVNEELKRVDVDKSGFISIASHQLRTPLTVIKGYSSMLLDNNFGELEEVTRKAMSKVFISSEQLINLVEDLLDISRIESGKETYDLKEGQLENLIDNIVEGLAMGAKEKKVKLIWEKPQKNLAPVMLDKEKLRQSCMNLIENAIKYTSKSDKSDATVRVLISEDIKNKKIKVVISDNGLGITKEDMKNLFTKFYRGRDKSIVATEGTGLGLYVAKQIIVEHGGEINVKSEGEGKGAEFSFCLPSLRK